MKKKDFSISRSRAAGWKKFLRISMSDDSNSRKEGDKFSKGVVYDSEGTMKSCVFCSIVDKTGPARIVEENDEFIVFRTLKPYAEHHLLVCPKRHVISVHELKGKEDADMVERMVKLGDKCLNSLEYTQKVPQGEVVVHKHCFHIPPYNSIDHLHLHSIGTGDAGMDWFGRLKYWDSTFYCKSAEIIVEELRKQQDGGDGGGVQDDKMKINGTASLKSKL